MREEHVVTDTRWKDQERSMQRAFARAAAEMLADDDNGPLGEVGIGRRFVVEATRSFDLSVARARAAGFTWEQIAERVPGYTRVYGAEAAEVVFNEVAVPRSGPDERYVSWRCGDCEGLVLDRGPYGGHPADAEPGHRTDCERFCRDVTAYVTDLLAEQEVDAGVDVGDDLDQGPAPARPMHIEGPGLEL
jgi:hypothetical protein